MTRGGRGRGVVSSSGHRGRVVGSSRGGRGMATRGWMGLVMLGLHHMLLGHSHSCLLPKGICSHGGRMTTGGDYN